MFSIKMENSFQVTCVSQPNQMWGHMITSSRSLISSCDQLSNYVTQLSWWMFLNFYTDWPIDDGNKKVLNVVKKVVVVNVLNLAVNVILLYFEFCYRHSIGLFGACMFVWPFVLELTTKISYNQRHIWLVFWKYDINMWYIFAKNEKLLFFERQQRPPKLTKKKRKRRRHTDDNT